MKLRMLMLAGPRLTYLPMLELTRSRLTLFFICCSCFLVRVAFSFFKPASLLGGQTYVATVWRGDCGRGMQTSMVRLPPHSSVMRSSTARLTAASRISLVRPASQQLHDGRHDDLLGEERVPHAAWVGCTSQATPWATPGRRGSPTHPALLKLQRKRDSHHEYGYTRYS